MALPAVEKAKELTRGAFESLFGSAKKESTKRAEKPVVPEPVVEKTLPASEKKPTQRFRKLTRSEMAIGTKEEEMRANRVMPPILRIGAAIGLAVAGTIFLYTWFLTLTTLQAMVLVGTFAGATAALAAITEYFRD